MHILYQHQYFVPPDGIGGTRSYEMARRLVKAGHRVTMITSSAFFPEHYRFDDRLSRLEMDGIELLVIRIPYSNKLSYLERIKAFGEFAIRALLATTKVKDVDLLFATSTPLTIAIPAVFGKFWHNRPMVFEVRDLWPELPIAIGALRNPVLKWLARWLERFAYANSAQVVALSPGMKEGVVRTGYPEETVTVIPNSCDVELFGRACSSDYFADIRKRRDQPVVLYAGTLGIINGVDYLVDIAEAMLKIDPEVCFVISGDGKQKQEVLDKASAGRVLGINLWVLQPVAKCKLPRLLSGCTVACSLVINCPALWHNSANKFFDTLAAGRPVMINHEGWQADVIRNSGAGVVVPADDPVAAARELHGFISDPRRLEKAGNAATELAATDFNRDRLFGKLLAVFESVHCKRAGRS